MMMVDDDADADADAGGGGGGGGGGAPASHKYVTHHETNHFIQKWCSNKWSTRVLDQFGTLDSERQTATRSIL